MATLRIREQVVWVCTALLTASVVAQWSIVRNRRHRELAPQPAQRAEARRAVGFAAGERDTAPHRVTELLVDDNEPLSPPVMKRARMVRLMKTAMAIREEAQALPLKRMAQMLVEQLIEIMPELKEVNPWNAVGQRRTLDELGQAADRRLSLDALADLME